MLAQTIEHEVAAAKSATERNLPACEERGGLVDERRKEHWRRRVLLALQPQAVPQGPRQAAEEEARDEGRAPPAAAQCGPVVGVACHRGILPRNPS